MRRRVAAAVAVLVAVGGLAGCGKQIDAAVVSASQVPGTTNLYRFCDGSTLIYYSDWDASQDEYEFIVYDGCKPPAQVPPQSGVQNLPDQEN